MHLSTHPGPWQCCCWALSALLLGAAGCTLLVTPPLEAVHKDASVDRLVDAVPDQFAPQPDHPVIVDSSPLTPDLRPDACVPTDEICDGKDNNCNGTIDEGFDQDQDGYTTCQGDCADDDKTRHPGAAEICNGKDDNCTAGVDEGTVCHSAALHPGDSVQCQLFDSGYTNLTGAVEVMTSPAVQQVCAPFEGCRMWWGLCKIPAAAGDGHEHTVQFVLFDDDYANATAPDTAVSNHGNEPTQRHMNGSGDARAWFGLPVVSTAAGHTHSVDCQAFDSGVTNVTVNSKALYWYNATQQYCVSKGAAVACRSSFACKFH